MIKKWNPDYLKLYWMSRKLSLETKFQVKGRGMEAFFVFWGKQIIG